MPSLVIHAPDYQLARPDTRSFEDMLEMGIGRGYALNSTILRQLPPAGPIPPGWGVVLLCNNRGLRAEGELVRLEPAVRDGRPWFTKNHIRRYDVHVRNFEMVTYRPEALNRNGVAVI